MMADMDRGSSSRLRVSRSGWAGRDPLESTARASAGRGFAASGGDAVGDANNMFDKVCFKALENPPGSGSGGESVESTGVIVTPASHTCAYGTCSWGYMTAAFRPALLLNVRADES